MNEKKIDEIQELLEIIINLLRVLNEPKLNQLKRERLQIGSLDERVYQLCNGINTTAIIAQETQKSSNHISNVLARLKTRGLIRMSVKNGKKIYRQVF